MSTPKGGRRARRHRASGAGDALRRPVSSYGDKSTRVLYVAAEGARTERDYLRLIEEAYGQRPGRPAFRIHYAHPGHDNGLRPTEVVDRVLAVAPEPDSERWAFFDRDAADNRDAEIPRALRRAAENGVRVALSHPSFELWLLLHFQHFTSQENGLNARVLDRLRRHRDAKGFENYAKSSGERGKGLSGQRGQSLLGREPDAIRNARDLVARCPHGGCSAAEAAGTRPGPGHGGHAAGCDPLRRDPSSDVWLLLVALEIGTEADR